MLYPVLFSNRSGRDLDQEILDSSSRLSSHAVDAPLAWLLPLR